jgi:hypothetical protein
MATVNLIRESVAMNVAALNGGAYMHARIYAYEKENFGTDTVSQKKDTTSYLKSRMVFVPFAFNLQLLRIRLL